MSQLTAALLLLTTLSSTGATLQLPHASREAQLRPAALTGQPGDGDKDDDDEEDDEDDEEDVVRS